MNKRIEYIDAMRGVTMFLVVLAHSAAFCFGGLDGNIFIQVFQSFRMPLFFFISGFVFFKSERFWSGKECYNFMKKKFSVQIISPLLFLLAYTYVFRLDFCTGIQTPMKMGYWFTFTLFEFYLIYILIELLLNKFRVNNDVRHILHICLSGVFIILSHERVVNSLHWTGFWGFLGLAQWQYYIYFILGIIVRRNYARFMQLLDSAWLLISCFAIFVCLFVFAEYTAAPGIKYVAMLAKATAGIVITVAFFKKHEVYFTSDGTLGKMLQFVGRRTLDIYLIHYFLLPRGLVPILSPIKEYNLPLMEFAIVVVLALIVTLFSLLISSILRTSPDLAKFLFGKK